MFYNFQQNNAKIATYFVEKRLSVIDHDTTTRLLSVLEKLEEESVWKYLKEISNDANLQNCFNISLISRMNFSDDIFKNPSIIILFFKKLVKIYTEKNAISIDDLNKKNGIKNVFIKKFKKLEKKGVDINNIELVTSHMLVF